MELGITRLFFFQESNAVKKYEKYPLQSKTIEEKSL